MNSEFELIRYNRRLPARIEIRQGAIETPYHWHKEIELVYVLDGALEITVNNAAQTLRVNEFRLFDKTLYSSVFKVVSGSGAEEELRNLLWQLSRTTDESELPDLRQYGLITDLLHVLFVQCRHENPDAVKEGENIQSRHVKLAIEYIEQHYREHFTENSVADQLGVQPVYLARRFKEATGKTFTKYILEFRLARSMDALVNKGMSIDDAAKAGGFPSKRTFVAKCKQAYGVTPFQLKKQQQSGDAPLMNLTPK